MDFERQMEFLLQNQAHHDAKIAQLIENHRQHDAEITRILGMQAKNEAMQAKNEKMMADLMESVGSLARIAHAHENRITRIEDRA
ncbi:MAG: hypothetical protein ABIR70_05400 [Bryobacteraceae bacterium]